MLIVILKVTVPTFMQTTNTDLKLIWVPDTPLHILLHSHILGLGKHLSGTKGTYGQK